jgi:hypothetical protein
MIGGEVSMYGKNKNATQFNVSTMNSTSDYTKIGPVIISYSPVFSQSDTEKVKFLLNDDPIEQVDIEIDDEPLFVDDFKSDLTIKETSSEIREIDVNSLINYETDEEQQLNEEPLDKKLPPPKQVELVPLNRLDSADLGGRKASRRRLKINKNKTVKAKSI